ncbi:methyl-accepting chemotaxis protein, partial [Stenotrophomonas acidaminiphila]|uniref:methyl-accepting chemotaxis protein n=1 Tax=Stenotrophomonas acidaminiphila TaxID=128780 RepID=UPI001FAFBE98
AQRSAGAAKEIKELIENSVDKVAEGSALVHQAGSTMGEIVTSVQRVTDIMAEISAASQEQSAGIEQVNQTVMQMDETTQQNAALVEEATAAARSMEDQANQLAAAVGHGRAGAAVERGGLAVPADRGRAAHGPGRHCRFGCVHRIRHRPGRRRHAGVLRHPCAAPQGLRAGITGWR